MKLDGYRMHARLDAGRVQILTRRGNDWTQKYPTITKAIAGLPAQNAYLDGELCGVLPDGKTAFDLIQNATDSGGGLLVFFLFDLLFLDGEDIQACRWATDGESRGCLMAVCLRDNRFGRDRCVARVFPLEKRWSCDPCG
jgi:bifunctional non-homologous end joining protein LigD